MRPAAAAGSGVVEAAAAAAAAALSPPEARALALKAKLAGQDGTALSKNQRKKARKKLGKIGKVRNCTPLLGRVEGTVFLLAFRCSVPAFAGRCHAPLVFQ